MIEGHSGQEDLSAESAAEAGLGLNVGKHLQANMRWEPCLTLQFLPRCHQCGNKHPHAYEPPLDLEICPRCGAILPTNQRPVTVPAVLTGKSPSTLLARALFAAGSYLSRLRKDLRK